MTDTEVDFIADAVCFLVDYGARFISLYQFDRATGKWAFADANADWRPASAAVTLSFKAPLGIAEPPVLSDDARAEWYKQCMAKAKAIAEALPQPTPVLDAAQPNDEQAKTFKQLLEFNLS